MDNRTAINLLRLFALFFASAFVHAQNAGGIAEATLPGKHRGAVTAIAHNGSEILSAGEDGFLEIWDAGQNAAAFRFQISPWRIDALELREGTNEICVIENDEMGRSRISAWDYAKRQKLFSLPCGDPVTCVSYSGGGSFIIAAMRGSAGLLLLDSQTGEIREQFDALGGMASFAATGRAERNMLVYLVSGAVAYLDLTDKTETSRFAAPPGIARPVLFANKRCLAGTGQGGLVVFDAAGGNILGRDNSVSSAALLCPAGDAFYCLEKRGNGAELRRYAIDQQGRLVQKERAALSYPAASAISVIAADNERPVFGTADGSLLLPGKNGALTEIAHQDQIRLAAIAVSGTRIAFLTAGGKTGFLPLDYGQFAEDTRITLTDTEAAYDELCPFQSGEYDSGNEKGAFLLWKNGAAMSPALIGESGAPRVLREIQPRFPLLAVSAKNGKVLTLDSAGTIGVYSPGSPENTRPFTFSAKGALDAAFANAANIMVCRPALSSQAPFLMVNITTGETVPLAWRAQAGLQVYTGETGGIYAAAVTADSSGFKTSLLRLNSAAPSQSVTLAELQGEDNRLSIAESAGIPASTLGGEGAAIYGEKTRYFERTKGLPVQLASSPRFFIALDSEGSVSWHDNQSGKLLALFAVYPERWTLNRDGGQISGSAVTAPGES